MFDLYYFNDFNVNSSIDSIKCLVKDKD